MQVSVADAKNKLPQLIRAVEDGKPVTICRRGVPVADIVRTKKPTRKETGVGDAAGQDPGPRPGLVEADDRR